MGGGGSFDYDPVSKTDKSQSPIFFLRWGEFFVFDSMFKTDKISKSQILGGKRGWWWCVRLSSEFRGEATQFWQHFPPAREFKCDGSHRYSPCADHTRNLPNFTSSEINYSRSCFTIGGSFKLAIRSSYVFGLLFWVWGGGGDDFTVTTPMGDGAVLLKNSGDSYLTPDWLSYDLCISPIWLPPCSLSAAVMIQYFVYICVEWSSLC